MYIAIYVSVTLLGLFRVTVIFRFRMLSRIKKSLDVENKKRFSDPETFLN